MRSRVVAPSDLEDRAALTTDGWLVGGRVEWVGDDELVLADALGRLRLDGAAPWVKALSVGDWVVLGVVEHDQGLSVESLQSHQHFSPPSGAGEWARMVWSGRGRHLRMRDRARRALRRWFESEGFLEIETPTWLRVPGLDSEVDAIAAEQGWLVTSPELCMKRLLVGGVPRVYQFAKCFRREEQGPRHEPEFTMLEWYRANSDLQQILDDTEALVMAAADAVGTGPAAHINGRRVRLERPFLRLTVAEAFQRHAGVDQVDLLARNDRDAYFRLFVDRVEPSLAAYDRPLFLHAYPASQAALARLRSDDPRWAERAELYLGGIELCNGYSELGSGVEQRARFEAEIARRSTNGDPVYPLDERFLSALEEGMPESAGNALGFDRLVMALLGTSSVQDVMAFARREL